LFDSPPLLLTNESRALAQVMGQVVLVVKASDTPQQAVFDALHLLGDQVSVGLVLNQSNSPDGAGYYHYRGGAYGSYGAYGAGASDSAD
jgi:Mrp family chromosome partitioning ATPase